MVCRVWHSLVINVSLVALVLLSSVPHLFPKASFLLAWQWLLQFQAEEQCLKTELINEAGRRVKDQSFLLLVTKKINISQKHH